MCVEKFAPKKKGAIHTEHTIRDAPAGAAMRARGALYAIVD